METILTELVCPTTKKCEMFLQLVSIISILYYIF
jgi:hypothetical protein